MTTSTTTAPAVDADQIAKRVEKKLKHAAKFATEAHAYATPTALRKPHPRAAWTRLTEAERIGHIRTRIEVEVKVAALAEVKAPASAPAPAKEAPAKPRHSNRWLVACIGCGAFIPATSAKPAVVRCGDEHRAASASTKTEPVVRSRGEISTFDLIQRYRDEADERAEDGVQSGESPAKKAAKKRRKRRAVCPNTPKPSADLV